MFESKAKLCAGDPVLCEGAGTCVSTLRGELKKTKTKKKQKKKTKKKTLYIPFRGTTAT
jgi:hypothetical protein